MFDRLQNKFSKIFSAIKGHGKISEKNISEAIREIRIALLESDVHFKVVSVFIKRVKEKALGVEVFDSITPGQQFIKIVQDELVDFLSSEDIKINIKKTGITTIVMAGLQGSGKTTTSAKIASFLKREYKKKPLLIGADLQRLAAQEQLRILGDKIDVDIYLGKEKDPLNVVKSGLSYAKSNKNDIVIIDTAGRLHIDNSLMDELKRIVDFVSPNEILYIADGMTGQDAVNSSGAFNEILNITGIILTKMDGDSRGGAALSIREVTQKPIKFLGMGEDIESFELFHPDRLVQRILGMGDVVSLVEKAQESFDIEKAEKIQKKLLNNSFTFVDFQEQLKQMNKMGNLTEIMNLIPGFSQAGKTNVDNRQLKWTDAIINSMTIEEKNNPLIINGSRRQRIAKGSGRSVQEVNQLIKQFIQMRQMMKKIGKQGMMKMPFKIK